ncbi:MAG: hypothetical protein ACI9C4_000282 [Paraglaciecola sp.]|jgi:hypothetical protein
MDRKLKSTLSFAACTLLAVMVIGQTSTGEGSLFCSCPQYVSFDRSLPMSHPINRCASYQADEISWSGWVKGHSASYQFHFIDLLELLSRYAEETEESQPTA